MNKNELAKRFLKTIPASMSLIRSHIKNASESELSFAKFRVLTGVTRGLVTVGQISENQCVSQPAISKLVDGLVCEGFLTRHENLNDRRVIELRLTKDGRKKYEKVKRRASQDFLPNLELLNSKEQNELEKALSSLEALFDKVQGKKV